MFVVTAVKKTSADLNIPDHYKRHLIFSSLSHEGPHFPSTIIGTASLEGSVMILVTASCVFLESSFRTIVMMES